MQRFVYCGNKASPAMMPLGQGRERQTKKRYRKHCSLGLQRFCKWSHYSNEQERHGTLPRERIKSSVAIMHTLPFNFPHSSLWVRAIIFPTSQMLKQRLGRFGWTAWSTQREGFNPPEDSVERMVSRCNLLLDSDSVWSECRHQEAAEQEIFPFLFQLLPLTPSSSSFSFFLFPFPTLYPSLLNSRWGNDLVI